MSEILYTEKDLRDAFKAGRAHTSFVHCRDFSDPTPMPPNEDQWVASLNAKKSVTKTPEWTGVTDIYDAPLKGFMVDKNEFELGFSEEHILYCLDASMGAWPKFFVYKEIQYRFIKEEGPFGEYPSGAFAYATYFKVC